MTELEQIGCAYLFKMMSRVSRKVHDKCLLKLIGRYLRSGVMIDGKVYPTWIGMPQGGPLSPLLSNVVLDELDKELEYRGHGFARYCDDFVILVIKSACRGTGNVQHYSIH